MVRSGTFKKENIEKYTIMRRKEKTLISNHTKKISFSILKRMPMDSIPKSNVHTTNSQ